MSRSSSGEFGASLTAAALEHGVKRERRAGGATRRTGYSRGIGSAPTVATWEMPTPAPAAHSQIKAAYLPHPVCKLRLQAAHRAALGGLVATIGQAVEIRRCAAQIRRRVSFRGKHCIRARESSGFRHARAAARAGIRCARVFPRARASA